MSESESPKIYLWPNLMTAGNLFCGFMAIFQIVGGMLEGGEIFKFYYNAIAYILAACVFDLLDGRVARYSGGESAFGREFDSLADIVSFGIAPALLVYDIILKYIPDQLGLVLAFVYLLCGAMRLARFNVIAAESGGGSSKDFQGFPIPAAAGVISSLTLLLLFVDENIGVYKWLLPPIMLTLSIMMFSNIKYPSFKGLNWKTKRSLPWVFVVIIVLIATVTSHSLRHIMPAVFFVSYLLYGCFRPWVSRRWRRGIEESLGDGIEPEEPEDEEETIEQKT